MRKITPMSYPVVMGVAAAILATLAACSGSSTGIAKRSSGIDGTCKAAYVGTLSVNVNDDGRSMTLNQPYAFGDARCTLWTVPAGAHVDGASIPRIFWSVLGGPFEGKYRNASVIHDWFCDRRTMSWQRVHRMFHEAMEVSGVETREAKLMYLAVYYEGPRWTEQAILNNRLVNRYVPVSGFDPALLQRYKEIAYAREPGVSTGVRYIVNIIDKNNIDLDQIDALAEQVRVLDDISDANPRLQ